MNDVIRQAGAIPFRQESAGLQVLLITSRDSGRWVFPKGNIEKGQTAPQAAEREAFEEAGIRGVIDPAPLGTFGYGKKLRSGRIKDAIVEVFALRAARQVKKFPERGVRRFEWMTVEAAVLLVQEPGAVALLQKLRQLYGAQPAHR